jgi:alkylation response protein AidB-like acyl-CoA dehydrogenase
MSALLERASALAPMVAARSVEFEEARRLPADVAAQFAEAGFFRMLAPRQYGGAEVAPAEAAAVMERIARADASAGWCIMIGATTGMNGAYLPAHWAKEIYGEPLMITGGAFAPMGKAIVEGESYRVNGKWPWGSGTQNCGWILGGCLIVDNGAVRMLANGQPDHRMVYFKASDVIFHDTWHVAGLKGTGSLDYEVRDLIVPADRAVSLIVDKPRVDAPLYRFPPFALLAMGIAAVALGNARGAIDALDDLAGVKRPQGSKRTLAERATTQAERAKAEAMLASARAYFFDEMNAAFARAERGDGIGLETRAVLRLAATHAVRTSAEVCRMMYDLGGGSSVYLSSALQRRFRDAHVATQHMATAPATYELAGRVLLNLETDAGTL